MEPHSVLVVRHSRFAFLCFLRRSLCRLEAGSTSSSFTLSSGLLLGLSGVGSGFVRPWFEASQGPFASGRTKGAPSLAMLGATLDQDRVRPQCSRVSGAACTKSRLGTQVIPRQREREVSWPPPHNPSSRCSIRGKLPLPIGRLRLGISGKGGWF